MSAAVTDIIGILKSMGYVFSVDDGKAKFRYIEKGEPPEAAKALLDALRLCKAEVVAYLKEILPLPFLDADGSLIIPFNCDRRFHYWNGGQSIAETEEEVRQWLH